MVDRSYLNWCGCAVNIPAVGEGVVTDVGGGGGEGGDGSFGDIVGNGNGLDGGWKVINRQVYGGEIGNLSVGAEAEVGEAIDAYIGGIWGIRVGKVPSWEG